MIQLDLDNIDTNNYMVTFLTKVTMALLVSIVLLRIQLFRNKMFEIYVIPI